MELLKSLARNCLLLLILSGLITWTMCEIAEQLPDNQQRYNAAMELAR